MLSSNIVFTSDGASLNPEALLKARLKKLTKKVHKTSSVARKGFRVDHVKLNTSKIKLNYAAITSW